MVTKQLTKIICLLFFMSILTTAQIVPRSANIVAGEYFIGKDPGEGRANPLNLNPSSQIEVDISLLGLQVGQTISVRFKDSNGKWSASRGITYRGQAFNREQNITYAEYFIGSDPGFGKGFQVSLSSGLAPTLEIQNVRLNPGQIISVRLRDSENRWGPATAVKYPSQIIRAAEIVVGSNPKSKQPGTGIPMKAVDGLFNDAVEQIEGTLSSWNRTDTIWVRAQNSDYFWSVPAGKIQLSNPIPKLYSISPSRIGRGSQINISVYGENFIPASSVFFGQDIIINSITFVSPNQIIVYISIPLTATIGRRTVYITNPPPGGGSDSLVNAFTIDISPPVEVDTVSYLPTEFNLSQNFPNPFNPVTTIKYTIPRSTEYYSVLHVTLKVYDILGREITTLVNEEKSPGNYEVKFDGSNLSSGVYLYRMQAGNFVQTKKLVLIK